MEDRNGAFYVSSSDAHKGRLLFAENREIFSAIVVPEHNKILLQYLLFVYTLITSKQFLVREINV